MNQIISPPASRQATVACPVCTSDGQYACPVCEGEGSYTCHRYGIVSGCSSCRGTGLTDCGQCYGSGYLTTDELADLARETQDAELAALVLERDPALTLEEMLGCDNIDALYGDLGGEA